MCCSVIWSKIAVFAAAGVTQLTSTPDCASSLPRDLVSEITPAFDALDLALASRAHEAQGKDGRPLNLRIVNSLWGQRELTFAQTYLDTMAVSYGAGIKLLDFGLAKMAHAAKPASTIANAR